MSSANEITELIWRKDRFYVKTTDSNTAMPRYIYVWNKHNPAFRGVPKGYVIHHLDHDKTNDDPSNLVLMQKYHHMAHHFKSKIITPSVTIEQDARPDGDYVSLEPTREPRIYYHQPAKRFYLTVRQKDLTGKPIVSKIWRDYDRPLLTKESAELLRDKIWSARGERI
jgi:hypothetical protein